MFWCTSSVGGWNWREMLVIASPSISGFCCTRFGKAHVICGHERQTARLKRALQGVCSMWVAFFMYLLLACHCVWERERDEWVDVRETGWCVCAFETQWEYVFERECVCLRDSMYVYVFERERICLREKEQCVCLKDWVWWEYLHLKLQAQVYDILPLEEDAGKRCSECTATSLTAVPTPHAHPRARQNKTFFICVCF